jgi:hypothetical protein
MNQEREITSIDDGLCGLIGGCHKFEMGGREIGFRV